MTKTFGDEIVGDVNIPKTENCRYNSKDLPHKLFNIMNVPKMLKMDYGGKILCVHWVHLNSVSLLEPIACWPLPYQNRDDGCVL